MNYIINPNEWCTYHKYGIINPTTVNKTTITGYEWQYEYGKYSLVEKSSTSIEVIVADISDNDLWKLCTLKPVPYYELKQYIENDDGFCALLHEKKISTPIKWDNTLNGCHEKIDLHLLIPCSYIPDNNIQHTGETCFASDYFIEQLILCNNTDFSNDYVKILNRNSLGYGHIVLSDSNGEILYYPFFSTISIHPTTHLAVVDIILMSLSSNSTIIVELFRNKQLLIYHGDHKISLEKWLLVYGLYIMGEHRSIVFSNNKLDTYSRLRYLVAEDNPMGNIIGSSFLHMANNNIAQYDTAEVYASEIALVEICHCPKNSPKLRLKEQAIEIFFIELLLLQDASICSVNASIETVLNDELKNSKHTLEELIILVGDLSKATKFFDPLNFRYPTVRASSIRIADFFGLPRQKKLLEENKSILEQLINLKSIRLQTKENEIINIILTILAIIQIVPLFLSDSQTIFYTCITGFTFTVFILILRYYLRRNIKKSIFNKRKTEMHNNNY